MAFTYEPPQKNNKFKYEPPSQASATTRVGSGMATSAAGFAGNIAQFPQDIFSELGDYVSQKFAPNESKTGKRFPWSDKETTVGEHNENPFTTNQLRNRLSQETGLSRQSLEPKGKLEKVGNFLAGEIVPFALGGGFKNIPSAINAGKSLVGFHAGSYVGAKGGKKIAGRPGEIIGGLAGGAAGAAGAHYIKPKWLLNQEAIAAKNAYETYKKTRLDEIQRDITEQIINIKKERDAAITAARNAKNAEIAALEHKGTVNNARAQEHLSEGGKLLEESRIESTGLSGTAQKIEQLSNQIVEDIQLGVAPADQSAIINTLTQLESSIADGSMTIADAQKFYQNLGKQTHKGMNADITSTKSIYNKKIQGILSDFIVEHGGQAGQKWLEGNKQYSVGKQLQKQRNSPQYKQEVRNKKRAIEEQYKLDVREAQKAAQEAQKKVDSEVGSFRKKLETETYQDYVKQQKVEAHKTSFETAINQGVKLGTDTVSATILSYLFGGNKGMYLAGIKAGRLGINGVKRYASLIKNNPQIVKDLDKLARYSLEGQQDLFNAQLLLLGNELTSKVEKEKK